MKIYYFKNTFNPKDIKAYEHDNLRQWFIDMELDPNQYHIADRKGEADLDCKSEIISVFPKIRGGSSKGKNIFAAVIGVALLLATGGTTAALFHSIGGLTMAHTLGAGLLLSGGGALIMGKMKMPQISADADSSSNASYQWNVGALNTSRGIKGVTFGSNVIPEGELLSYRTYGTSSIGAVNEQYLISKAHYETVNKTETIKYGFGKTRTRTYTERVYVPAQYGTRTAKYSVTKPNSYLEMLIGCGEGKLDSITDIKVNGIALSELANSGAYSKVYLGSNNQSAMGEILDNQVGYRSISQTVPMRLSGATDYLTVTTPVACDTFEISFQANGFYLYDTGSGAKNAAYAKLSIEYRKSGTSTWQTTNITTPLKDDAPFLSEEPFYFTATVKPSQGNGVYEIRVRNESAYLNNAKGLLSSSEFATLPDRALINFSIDNVACYSVSNKAYPNTAYIFLRLPASQALNGSMPSVTWKQSRANVIVYNTNNNTYTTKPANNLAWAIYDIFCQIRQDQYDNSYKVLGENPSHIDYNSFVNFAAFCESINAKGNWFLNRQRTAWETAQDIATSARAYIGLRNGRISPFWDASGNMSQIFTSGNIIEGSLNGGFISKADRATAIEATFNDEANEYKETTIRVNADDVDDGSEAVKITFAGLSSVSAVYNQARYLLRRNKYLTQTINFKASIDSIVCELGDIIGIQSDVTSWGAGGRVYSVTGNSVTLDTTVTLETGKSYSLVIRHSDGTLERKAPDQTNGSYNVLTFNSHPFSKAVLKGDVYSFGITSYETKPFRVESISRDSDQIATIEGIEYNENVYTAGTAPTINYTSVNAGINSLTAVAENDVINVAWEAPKAQYVDVYVNGEFYQRCLEDSLTLPAINDEYVIEAVPVAPDGTQGTAITKTINTSIGTPSQLNSPTQVLSSSGYLFTFTGIPLTENIVWIIIKEGTSEKARAAVSGSTVSINMSLSGGSHTLKAFAVNKYGKESPERSFSVSAPVIGGWTIDADKISAGNINIKSDGTINTSNYVYGVSGWQIKGDGTAEFNDVTVRGTVYASSGSFTGEVTASSGAIGNWTINSNGLSNTTGNYTLQIDPVNGIKETNNGTVKYQLTPAGKLTATDVDLTGKITATSGSFTGSITANSGSIGGWTIGNDNLTSNDGKVVLNKTGSITLTNGSNVISLDPANGIKETNNGTAKFQLSQAGKLTASDVELTGKITATSGKIANWTIDGDNLKSNNLILDGTNGAIKSNNYSSASAGWQIKGDGTSEFNNVTVRGAVYASSGSFTGEVTATSGSFTGSITANSGRIGGWSIDSGKLYNSKIQIDSSNNRIRTADYASGSKGWNIDSTSAEFNNVTVRGIIKSAVFEANEVTAIGGEFIVRPASKVTAVADRKLTLESVTGFAVNDFIRVKSGASNQYWGKITAISGKQITFTVSSGTYFTATVGQTVVNYGASGVGGILLDGNAPKLDMWQNTSTPWNGLTPTVRLGNLNGINGVTSNLNGIFIGNPSTEWLQYDSTNGLRMKGHVEATSGKIGSFNILGWRLNSMMSEEVSGDRNIDIQPWQINVVYGYSETSGNFGIVYYDVDTATSKSYYCDNYATQTCEGFEAYYKRDNSRAFRLLAKPWSVRSTSASNTTFSNAQEAMISGDLYLPNSSKVYAGLEIDMYNANDSATYSTYLFMDPTVSGNNLFLKGNYCPSDSATYTLGSSSYYWNYVYTIDLITNNGNVRPSTNNQGKLGTSSYYWGNAYINTLITNNGVIRPSTNGQGSLGTSSYYWSAGYINSLTTGSIISKTDNTYDLGSSSKRWKNIYVNSLNTNNITAQTDNTYNLGSTSYYWKNAYINNITSGNILPKATETYDLGSSTYKWNNIYGKNIYQNGSQVALKSEVDSAQTAADNAVATANSASTTANNALPKAGGTMTGTIESQGIYPKTTNTYNLGSSSYAWKAGYINSVYGQLQHSSNVAWNQLNYAAVYSPTAITSGVDYLWGVKTKNANKWLGVGVLEDNLQFVFFNNNLSENSFLNKLAISARDTYHIDFYSAGGYFGFSGHVKPHLNNTYQLGVSGASWKDIYVKAINGTSIGDNAVATFSSASATSNGTNTSSVYIHGVNLSGFKISVGYFTTAASGSGFTVSLPFSYSTVLFAVAIPAANYQAYNYAVSVSSSTATMSSLTKSKRHYILVIGV